jgi:hypothetical protein
MSRRSVPVILTVAAAVIVLFFTPVGEVASDTVQRVMVMNFPTVQEISGEVSVKDAPLRSMMSPFKGIMVPPVEPTDTTRLIQAGTLTADGYTNIVLSLHGLVKGEVTRTGSVGAFLVPSEQAIQQAFNELGLVHFAMEVNAPGIDSETAYFASAQPRYTVGFQTYDVLLYNTTDKTVTVDLYAYLTN